MLCPVCLSFAATERDGVAQVGGTVYCAQHSVEALDRAQGRGPQLRRPFTPPVPVTTPAPPAG